MSYSGTKPKLKFAGRYLKQDQISYIHGKVVNIYIVYELGASASNDNDPTLRNCLFGAVTLTKNVVMELDLIEDQVFHLQVVDLVKMY